MTADRPADAAADIDELIGRDADLVTILAQISRSRLVSLTGPGGSGKTRLAEAVVAAHRRDGREAWFIDAAAITDASFVAATIAAALRLQTAGPEGSLVAVEAALKDRPVLIAIDNVEQIEGIGAVVTDLLRALPELRVVVTSRTRLNARGETEYAVAPLALPSGSTLADLEASPAGRLFLTRTRESGRLDPIDDSTAGAIGDLIRRLDGLPLAVELAAARTRVLSPSEILTRLVSRGVGSIDAADDPHRSLTSIVEWSRSLLGSGEARVLDAVSICAGFDLAMVEALVPDLDAVTAIDALMSVGLAERWGTVARTTRFRLLETVRSVMFARLSGDDLVELRIRQAAATAAMVRSEVAREATGAPDARDHLDAEADNIRLALGWFEQTDLAQALDLWNDLFYPFWATRARLREGLARFDELAARVEQPTRELARAMVRYAMNHRWVGDDASLLVAIRRALETARAVGDAESEVESLSAMAATAANAGDALLAREVEDALAGLDPAPLDRAMQVRIAEARGHAATVLHGRDSDSAIGHLRAAIDLLEPDLRPRLEAALQGNLALALLHKGDFSGAVDAAGRAVAVGRRYESPLITWATATLAMALAETGEVGRAIETIESTITDTLASDMPVQTGDTLLAAMPVALAAGQTTLVARLWGAAKALEAAGATEFPADDRFVAERTLARARRRGREVEFELAIRDGAEADPSELLRIASATLKHPPEDQPATTTVRHGDLTRREVEILTLLAAGRSDGEIAAELFISPKTASVHVSNVKGKLGVDTRLEVVLKARDMGFGGSTGRPSG